MDHRSLGRRSWMTALAATVTLAGLAAPAVAAPGAPGPAPAAQAATPPRTATQDDKIRAAQVLNLVAGPELLVLGDKNFVFALWERATGVEVRASAELAYSGGDTECTQWIKTGVHDANARDQARKLQDDATAKANREAKQKAALVNGITATPELLIQSDKDFVFSMWERASGPKVKAAARAAFEGTAADQKTFILTGIVDARAADQHDVIEAKAEATAEQKRQMEADAARVRAATVVGFVATPGHLVEPDINFVMDLWDASKPATEVRAGAERALRSTDPAALTTYVSTGIHAANVKDWFAWIKKKGQADRRLAFELRTRSEQSGVHPALVAAANTAMAGTDDDVEAFLRLGQYEDSVLVQSLRSLSPATQGWYIRGVNDAVLGAGPGTDAAWRIVPGKADSTCHSLESVTHPEHYLRQQGFRVLIAPSDGTDQFRADATWCTKATPSGTGVSLESYTQRGRLMRQFKAQLWAANTSGQHDYDTATGYSADVTWQADTP